MDAFGFVAMTVLAHFDFHPALTAAKVLAFLGIVAVGASGLRLTHTGTGRFLARVGHSSPFQSGVRGYTHRKWQMECREPTPRFKKMPSQSRMCKHDKELRMERRENSPDDYNKARCLAERPNACNVPH